VYEVDQEVPYLFEEDFSSITNEQKKDGDNSYDANDSEHGGAALTQLPGWGGARFWAMSGAVRLNTRYQEVKIGMSFTTELFGRLDSTPLTKLKDGASVTVCVNFDAGAYVHSSSSFTVNNTYLNVATHNDSANPIKGMAEGNYLSGFSLKSYENTRAAMVTTQATVEVASGYGEDVFGKTYQSYSTGNNVVGVTRNTRLCFYASSLHSSGGISNCESNVYLDNIRVSIAK
jgi:hypothetical protein